MENPHYEIRDPRFRDLLVSSAGLDELYTGCRWAEGPVWFNDGGYLLFSDIHNNKRMKYTPGNRRVAVSGADKPGQRADPRPAGAPARLRT